MNGEAFEHPAPGTLPSSLPRAFRPGPGGLSARVAGGTDEEAVVRFLRDGAESGRARVDPDTARWVLQSILRSPLHGFVVMADSRSPPPGAGRARGATPSA